MIPTVFKLVYQALNLTQIGRCLRVVKLVSQLLAYGAVKTQHFSKNNLKAKQCQQAMTFKQKIMNSGY